MAKRRVKCPKCGETNLRVAAQRAARDGKAIYRDRECRDCNHWFNTEEIIAERNLRLNIHEDRLVTIYRKLSHAKRKALWNLLKLI